ncbi:hypothetical protein F2Q68_00007671 [Brassica cretica]|uniref:Uncharacterized protein n=1 Tax=Brassica cretica TaxID=69181 RepID=A0A8S9KS36_BRACR|nr:hypothetical protein F2Q68_00007671 [Brassica cretica]
MSFLACPRPRWSCMLHNPCFAYFPLDVKVIDEVLKVLRWFLFLRSFPKRLCESRMIESESKKGLECLDLEIKIQDNLWEPRCFVTTRCMCLTEVEKKAMVEWRQRLWDPILPLHQSVSNGSLDRLQIQKTETLQPKVMTTEVKEIVSEQLGYTAKMNKAEE